jgi:hypothetical protein
MCAEGEAVMDGALSTMKQSSHRSTSQSSYSSGKFPIPKCVEAPLFSETVE